MTTETIPFESVPCHDASAYRDGIEVLVHDAGVLTVRTAGRQSITINGIPYSLTAMLYPDRGGGSWHVGHAEDTYGNAQTGPRQWYGSIYGNRTDRVFGETFTPSAKVKAVELAEVIANEWARDHVAEIVEGRKRAQRQDLRQLLSDRAKIADQLADLDSNIAHLERIIG